MAVVDANQNIDASLSKSLGPAIDPWCKADSPVVVHFQDVSEAAFKIRGGIIRTPCQRSHWLSTLTGVDLYLKKDFLQLTGSFKERGARFCLLKLTEKERARGVVAASAGNHAMALSYHGQQLGVKVTVVMPTVAPMMKISRCKSFGANVIIEGHDMGECKTFAINLAREANMVYINGYDHPHILAGQGTVGLEIMEDVPNLDAVLVPVGGGGLLAGCCVAIKYLFPHVQVIGVESEHSASFTKSLAAGKPVFVQPGSTLADGLAVPMVGFNAFETARKLVDKIVMVKEESVALAILRLVEMEKAVLEGAGAVPVAALLQSDCLPELKGKRVCALLSGGNIDTSVLGRCLERGLALDGRLFRFSVTVVDRPGGIADLSSLLAELGASIKDIFHERAWIKTDIHSVRVKCVVETRDFEHCDEITAALKKHYTDVLVNQPMFNTYNRV